MRNGLRTFRLPFRWERLQPDLERDLDRAELSRIRAVVDHAERVGATIIINPHNFAMYRAKVLGSEERPPEVFARFWTLLAREFKNRPNVIFGLMNEPMKIPSTTWRAQADAAVAAIRAEGANNLVLVPGNLWSGAHAWTKRQDGGSNADVMEGFVDPASNYAFDLHQYLDKDYSGTDWTCRGPDTGPKALAAATEWMRNHGRRAFLSEFGAADNPLCLEALENTLRYLDENSDVWIGWTYWAAGAWWKNYPMSVQPSAGQDRPQLGVLKAHAGGG